MHLRSRRLRRLLMRADFAIPDQTSRRRDTISTVRIPPGLLFGTVVVIFMSALVGSTLPIGALHGSSATRWQVSDVPSKPSAPQCSTLAGRPLPQAASDLGCLDGTKALSVVRYQCRDGQQLTAIFNAPGDPFYWSRPGEPVKVLTWYDGTARATDC